MFAYRVKVLGQWREFDFRPLAEVPRHVIIKATEQSLIWDVLSWGLMDPVQMELVDQMPMRRIYDMVEIWEDDSSITIDEIRSVIKTVELHGQPLEYDLIKMGLRLRNCPSPEFNWRDLWLIISYADIHSQLLAATSPEKAGWDRQTRLLADIADNQDWLVWAKTAAAHELGATPPLRRERPGVSNPKPREGSKVKPAPISKIRKIYKLDERHARQGETLLDRKRKLEAVFR